MYLRDTFRHGENIMLQWLSDGVLDLLQVNTHLRTKVSLRQDCELGRFPLSVRDGKLCCRSTSVYLLDKRPVAIVPVFSGATVVCEDLTEFLLFYYGASCYTPKSLAYPNRRSLSDVMQTYSLHNSR